MIFVLWNWAYVPLVQSSWAKIPYNRNLPNLIVSPGCKWTQKHAHHQYHSLKCTGCLLFFFSSKIYCNVAETHIHTHTSEVGKAVNACAVIKDEQAKWRRCYTFMFSFWETCFSSYWSQFFHELWWCYQFIPRELFAHSCLTRDISFVISTAAAAAMNIG